MSNDKPRYWFGSKPTTCDVCQQPIGQEVGDCFVDGATKRGPWALMCLTCWTSGIGLGKLGGGMGQKYMLVEGGKWLKVEG